MCVRARTPHFSGSHRGQGCAFLYIPHAFVASGALLGPLVLVALTLLCNASKDFVLVALARLEALARANDARGNQNLVADDFVVG